MGGGNDITEHFGNPLNAIHGIAIVVPLDRPFVWALTVLADLFSVLEPEGGDAREVIPMNYHWHRDGIIVLAYPLAIV